MTCPHTSDNLSGLSIGLDHFFSPVLFDKERLSGCEVVFDPTSRESIVAKNTLLELSNVLGVQLKSVTPGQPLSMGFSEENHAPAAISITLNSTQAKGCTFIICATSWSNEVPDTSVWKEHIFPQGVGVPVTISKIYIHRANDAVFLVPIAYGKRMTIGALSLFLK